MVPDMDISNILELIQAHRVDTGDDLFNIVLGEALQEFQEEIKTNLLKNLALELNNSEKLEDDVRRWIESELVLWGGFGSQDRSELSKVMYPHVIKVVMKAIDKNAEYKPRVIIEEIEE